MPLHLTCECRMDDRIRPLYLAVQHGHVDVVRMLIANGASMGCVGKDIVPHDVPSPLILAIRCGRADIVAILLQHGASVDERERGSVLEYPAHAAVLSGNFEILKMVLDKKPKLDCVDWM
jgi:ankyrin repeat protein